MPRWIVGVIRRGLARDPDDRFDTMEALLKELRRDPRRKWWIGVAGTLGVGAAVFLGIGAYQKVLTGACDDFAESMGTTWNPQRREAMVASIAGADVPWAEQVAKSTADVVEAYAEAWGRRVQDECLASQVGSEAAKTTWTNKRLCFEDRRSGVDVLISQLIDGGDGMATTALQAAVSLPDLDACRDSQRLAMWALMSDPKAQERLAYARRRLVRAEMVGSLGKSQKAIEAATAVIEDARELGVPALEAAGLLVRGLNRIRIGENDPEVEEDLKLAVERAQEAGDAATRAKALIQLGAAVGREPTRFKEAFAIGERAREAIESLGSAPLLGARLQAMLGVAARRAGDWDAAIAYNRESIATLETLLGESHPDTVRTLNGLGISLCRKGEFEEALAALRRTVAAYETVLGGNHPDLFTVLQSLGVCLARQDRTEEALEMLTRALANYRQGESSDETRILTYEYNIAFVHYRSGNHQESLRRAQAGLPRAKKLLAGRPKRLADWHGLLGKSLMGTGDAKGAAAALKDALAIQRGAKASAADTLHLQLRIALSTAEFDRARGLVLVEALQEELVRAPSSRGIDSVRAELEAWLAKSRQEGPPPSPEPDGEPPATP
ncbi:MAG: tetratricopeptide repeat protein [Nannocystaceae bacterium]|nr:tetratricopeptide repeat protein [Nannocystaceae bacterium]